MVRKKMCRMRYQKYRWVVYLDEDDVEFLEEIMEKTGIKKKSEVLRFIIKVFRFHIYPELIFKGWKFYEDLEKKKKK